MSVYHLGKKSESVLSTVHPDLCTVVRRAIELTEQDFAAWAGLRSLEQQKEYVKRKVSTTLRSRHLTGHAVDLVAWHEGAPSWREDLLFEVAEAMREACIQTKIPLKWGGCWDREVQNLDPGMRYEVEEYRKRRRQLRKRVFIDLPHWELVRRVYP